MVANTERYHCALKRYRDSSPSRGVRKIQYSNTWHASAWKRGVRMVENSSANGRSVIPAIQKYCWRLWLAGLLLSGTCFAQDWGSAGGGYIYQLTESAPAHWTSSHGWYGLGTFNINKQVGLFADFANFYAPGQNIHVQLYGVLHAFGNKTRFTPFIFIGPGFYLEFRGGNCELLVCGVRWRRPLDPAHALGIVPDYPCRICHKYCPLERRQQLCCESRICTYLSERLNL